MLIAVKTSLVQCDAVYNIRSREYRRDLAREYQGHMQAKPFVGYHVVPAGDLSREIIYSLNLKGYNLRVFV